jgi:glycerol-3-phosphate dehydrogenase
MKINEFDIIVIGGGATGFGIAVDAQNRGYKTLLVEAHDFASGTSSKSTKLIHGGIRYLANLDFNLVKEGLEERYYMLKNAPHINHKQTYLIPFYSIIDRIKYFCGIKIYDFLAKDKKIGKSFFNNKNNTLKPELAKDLIGKNLNGSAIYYDGAFDDSRLVITLFKTFEKLGGNAKNYHEVIDFYYTNNKISGIKVIDKLNNHQIINYHAPIIINATGIFTDKIIKLSDKTNQTNYITLSQGTHLVFNKEIFSSQHALVIPKTSDGRVLFVLPWHDKIVVGTTDIIAKEPLIYPNTMKEEIDFIINTFNFYTKNKVKINDIKSIFTGQRPLVNPNKSTNTSKISRKHEILEEKNGLISIVGGKWTIYRKMAEDTLNYIENKLQKKINKTTKDLKLFGYTNNIQAYPANVYGSEWDKIIEIAQNTNFNKLHAKLPYLQAEVIYHIRFEMAKTIEDILARRTRALFLDANISIEIAPIVANIIKNELHLSDDWVKIELENFYKIAEKFTIKIYNHEL